MSQRKPALRPGTARNPEAGVSIVEVLIGMLLVAIIATFSWQGVAQYRGYSKTSQARDEVVLLARAIEAGYPGNGYPANLTALNAALPRYRVTLPAQSRIKWYALTPGTASAPEGFSLCVELGPAANPVSYSAYSSVGAGGAEGKSSGKGACPTTPAFVGGSSGPSPSATSLPCPVSSVSGTGGMGALSILSPRKLTANWSAVTGATGYTVKMVDGAGVAQTASVPASARTYAWNNLAQDTYSVLVTATDAHGESGGCTFRSYTFAS